MIRIVIKDRNYIECLRKLPYDIKKTIESSNENKDMMVDYIK